MSAPHDPPVPTPEGLAAECYAALWAANGTRSEAEVIDGIAQAIRRGLRDALVNLKLEGPPTEPGCYWARHGGGQLQPVRVRRLHGVPTLRCQVAGVRGWVGVESLTDWRGPFTLPEGVVAW